jgi:hypothetical protein
MKMAEMVLPGVYIEERPEALIVAGPITVGNIGIVGTARRGPFGEVRILSSLADAIEAFGTYDDFKNPEKPENELTLVRALELAYANGASTVYAVRVSRTTIGDSSNADDFIGPWNLNTTAAKATFKLMGEPTKDEQGNTVLARLAAVLKARTHGTWGNEIGINVFHADVDSLMVNEKYICTGSTSIILKRQHIKEDPRNRIVILKIKNGQTEVFNTVYQGTPKTGEVKIDLASRVLTFATNEDPEEKDELYATYVIGKENSVNVTLRYGGITETYTVPDGNRLADLVNDEVSGSSLVTCSSEKDLNGLDLLVLPTTEGYPNDTTFLKFGKRIGDQAGNDGADADASHYNLGLQQLLNEDCHIIIAAGQEIMAVGDKLKSHVESASTDKIKRDRIAVVGSKKNATFEDISAGGNSMDSDRVIMVGPGIITTDAASGKNVTVPGAYAAAAIAGMLSSRSPHVSLTNKTVSAAGLETKLNPGQLEQLIKSRVMALEARQGVRIVKAITTSTNTAWQQITTRRITDYAKYGVRSACNPYIGLLNNDRVRKALKGSINGFLAGMVDDEMLKSYQLDVTATREEEIRGIAKVTMTLQPTFSIDYIKVIMYLG